MRGKGERKRKRKGGGGGGRKELRERPTLNYPDAPEGGWDCSGCLLLWWSLSLPGVCVAAPPPSDFLCSLCAQQKGGREEEEQRVRWVEGRRGFGEGVGFKLVCVQYIHTESVIRQPIITAFKRI